MNDFRLGDNSTNTASSRGLYVESFEDFGIPATRQEKIEIPNRNGFLTVGDSSLRGVQRIAHCYLTNKTNNTPVYVLNWLRQNNKVFFSDEDASNAGSGAPHNLFRYYSITSEIKARRPSGSKGYELDVVFECQPFRYWEDPTTVNISYAEGTSTEGKVITNSGNAANAPLIRVGRVRDAGGAAWIAWGSYASERIEFDNLQYPLYIDSELKEVYYEDSTHGNANAITSLKKFPTVPSLGTRTIKFGGNVATLVVQMRERMF